ncbi:MAG: cupin domain-containing protein [Pseudomonadota bacterium]
MNSSASVFTALAAAAGLRSGMILAVLCWFVATPASSSETIEPPLTAADLITALGLEGHVEGGFYRRTFEASNRPRIVTNGGERFSMTSIFYLLTEAGPIGHFHKNRSDIVHYFQGGNPIDYFLIHADGSLDKVTMGPDPRQGHLLQLTVAGGVWKASRLRTGSNYDFGLISEAVSPGFDYADMTLADQAELVRQFPQHAALIRDLTRD